MRRYAPILIVAASLACARSNPGALPNCSSDADCAAESACTVGVCESGFCAQRNVADGTTCNDSLHCTVNDVCTTGVCNGLARDCSSLDSSCTRGACSEADASCVAIAEQMSATEGPFGSATCSDGLDNDCDGATDDDDASCTSSDWWDLDWPSRVRVAIDARSINTVLQDFPVAVRLSDTFLLDASPQGAIRFIASDGDTELAYERESDVDGILFWVRVPSVTAVSDQGFFWAYFRDSTTVEPNPSEVWSNGFAAVWHMQVSAGSQVHDSTANGKHGTLVGMSASDAVATPLGLGLHFAHNAGIRVPCPTLSDVLTLGAPADYTLEAWARSETPTSGVWGIIVARQQGNSYDDAYYLGEDLSPTPHAMTFRTDVGTAASPMLTPPGYHVAGVRNSSALSLYLRGEAASSVAPGTPVTRDLNDVIIGAAENGSNASLSEFWLGDLDEIRISSVARSADWVHASSLNVSGDWISVGEIEHL